jgi:23S rRNA pseudouridine1911/1915/1917 synthase
VKVGSEIELAIPPPPPPKPELVAQEIPLSVVFEDDHMLVIDKPPGLVVHPAVGHRDGTLVNALLFRAQSWAGDPERPGIVHRLDKDTSGLLLVAKTAAAHHGLSRLMRNRQMTKEYLAVVYGHPPVRKGRIDLCIARDPSDRMRMRATKDEGRESTTFYELLSESAGKKAGLSLVLCRLVTGRTHQIRVHLKAIGLPIVGDVVYGSPRWRNLPDVDLAAACKEMSRQALHAYRLTFEHPVTKSIVTVTAPIPSDIAALLGAAGLGFPKP